MPAYETPAGHGSRDRHGTPSARIHRWPCRIATVAGKHPVTTATADFLLRRGIEWVEYPDVFSALIGMGASTPDVLILSTDSGGADFLDVVAAVTGRLGVPVLAGIRSDAVSQELGFHALEQGARGLIALPCAPERLVDSVSRLGLPASGMAADLICGPLVLSPQALRVTVNAEPVHLAPKEFEVLMYLMSQSPRAVPAGELAEHCDSEGMAGLHRIRLAVLRTRRKLEQAYSCRALIETVRGVGYRMAVD